MKRKMIITVLFCVLIASCQKDNQQVTPAISSTSASQSSTTATSTMGTNTDQRLSTNYASNWTSEWARHGAASGGSEFIPIVEANTMIASYLYSINAERNDSDLHSFSVDADMLRAYLADPAIKNVKLMFAHTPEYIKAGNAGKYAGYQSGAMTIVIAAYSGDGKYVFHNGMVLDHLSPCPSICPSGEAGSSLLY